MNEWSPLVGVVIAQTVILALFWLRQRSDDRRRWHEKRLATYQDFSRDLRALRQLILTASAGGRDLEASFASSEYLSAWDRLGDRTSDVMLLASDPVIQAAMSANDVFYELSRKRPFAEHSEMRQALNHQSAAFQNAVRRELGIVIPRRNLTIGG